MTSPIAEEIVAAGRRVAAKGWVPATSGNLSGRLDSETLLITASGIDKGELKVSDICRRRSSARRHQACPLKQACTRRRIVCGLKLVLWSMSIRFRRLCYRAGHAAAGEIVFEGYEILKAFAGIKTHDVAVRVPIFANSQDIAGLATEVEARLADFRCHRVF